MSMLGFKRRLGEGQLGAVLVFLSGMAEIRKCERHLQRSHRLDEQDVGPLLILPLHGECDISVP